MTMNTIKELKIFVDKKWNVAWQFVLPWFRTFIKYSLEKRHNLVSKLFDQEDVYDIFTVEIYESVEKIR